MIQFVIVAAKQILKPEDALSAESCLALDRAKSISVMSTATAVKALINSSLTVFTGISAAALI